MYLASLGMTSVSVSDSKVNPCRSNICFQTWTLAWRVVCEDKSYGNKVLHKHDLCTDYLMFKRGDIWTSSIPGNLWKFRYGPQGTHFQGQSTEGECSLGQALHELPTEYALSQHARPEIPSGSSPWLQFLTVTEITVKFQFSNSNHSENRGWPRIEIYTLYIFQKYPRSIPNFQSCMSIPLDLTSPMTPLRPILLKIQPFASQTNIWIWSKEQKETTESQKMRKSPR